MRASSLRRRRLIAGAMAAAGAAIAGRRATAAQRRLDGERARLEALAAALETPGALIGRRRADGGSEIVSIGERARGDRSPLPADLPLPIASVGKIIVGAATLVVCRDLRVSLDTPVRALLPRVPLPSPPPDLTLRQLGSHRSRLPEPVANPRFQEAIVRDPARRWSAAQILAHAQGAPRAYSNANSVLLGLVLERLRGQPIATVLRQTILAPLAMTATATPADSAWRAAGVRGMRHAREGRPLSYGSIPIDVTEFEPGWAGVAGDWSSTVADLLALLHGLQVERRLGDEVANGLADWSASTEVDTGLHWMRHGPLQGHSGDVPGFSAAAWWDSRSGDCWAALANLSNTRDGRNPAFALVQALAG